MSYVTKYIKPFVTASDGLGDKVIIYAKPLDCQTFPFHYIKVQCDSIEQSEVAWKIWIHSAHPSSLTQFRNSESSQ